MHCTGFSRVPYTLSRTGTESYRGQTPAKAESSGTAAVWTVTAQDFELCFRDIQWINGERSVVPGTVTRGRQALRHLEASRRRISAIAAGTGLRSDLSIARIDPTHPNEWSTLTNASAAEFAQIHGIDWADRLAEAFGARIGTKSHLLGTTDTTKNRLCAIYPRQSAAQLLPHLFVLTRVIPLALGMTK